MCAMQGDDGSPWWQYTSKDVDLSTDGTVLMGTNQMEDSPVKTVRGVIEVMLMGCVGVFKGIGM